MSSRAYSPEKKSIRGPLSSYLELAQDREDQDERPRKKQKEGDDQQIGARNTAATYGRIESQYDTEIAWLKSEIAERMRR